MPRKNAAAAEAEDLRGALGAIGRIIEDQSVSPKGKLQQIVGLLSVYDVTVTVPVKPVTMQLLPMLPEGEGL